jgi:hypothetical protein
MTHKPEIFKDKRYPNHLDMYVMIMARWISQAKDEAETIERVEFSTKEFGGEFTSYAMAILCIPKLMDMTKHTQEYKNFNKKTIN